METDDPTGFGVNLVAYIRAEMGLGTAARGTAHALEAARVPFNILNFEHSNPALHRDKFWQHKEVASSSYDFTLSVINPDNLLNARTRLHNKAVTDRYRIGYWFWELPQIPDSWDSSFSLVDEVWVGSRFIQDAISARSPLPLFRVPVAIRLGPTDGFSRESFGLPSNQFLFLSMSDAHSHLARKNPVGAIRAFKKAFGGENNAGLVLKVNNIDSAGADGEVVKVIREEIAGQANIYLLDSDMTRAQIDALLGITDCFLSLHRSEGFGLGPAEAMSLGKPAILTNWSGNTDYMTPENSIGIGYQLIPVGKDYGPYHASQLWADPDLEQAAYWMKRLSEDRELGRRIGSQGQETISKHFSPEAVGRIIQDRLVHLHSYGLARRPPKPTVNHAIARFETFAAHDGDPRPQRSNIVEVPPGQWTRLKVDLPWGLGDGTAPFRFDPVDRPGVVELAAVRLRSQATGEVCWQANRRSGLAELTVKGTAVRLTHERILRLLSYDEDPQVYLPLLPGECFEEPLTLEVLLRFDRAPETIERAVAASNAAPTLSKEVPSETEMRESLAPNTALTDQPAALVAEKEITMTVYSAGEGGYSEQRCTYVRYARDRWSHLTIALQLGLGSMPLRLDPLAAIGLVDVASFTIRSAIDDEVLWHANGDGSLQDVRVSGSAVRIPHPHLVRILSYGDDPQLYLPDLAGGKFDGPLRLEVWLKTETGLASVRKGIAELATASSEALAATTHTHGLLEQSSRAFLEKENELLDLKAQLEKSAAERTEMVGRQEQISRDMESIARAKEEAEVLLQQLREKHENDQRELTTVREQLASQHRESEALRKELENARTEIGFRETEVVKSRKELRQRIGDSKVQTAEIAHLKERLEATTREVQNISNEQWHLKTRQAVEQTATTRVVEEFIRLAAEAKSVKRALAASNELLEKKRNRFRMGWAGGAPPIHPAPESAANNFDSYKFWLDAPEGPTPAGEKVYFAGWVLPPENERVLCVRAIVGDEAFPGIYGFDRPDVAELHVERKDAASPGFSIPAPLPPGLHAVLFQALVTTGDWVTFGSHQHTVLEAPLAEPPSPKAVPPANTGKAFEGSLEAPEHEVVYQYGLLLVAGWVYFRDQPATSVIAHVDDGRPQTLAYGSRRDDVALHLPQLPLARYAGFAGYIPLESTRPGKRTLYVDAILDDGTRVACFQREFLLREPEQPPPPGPAAEVSHRELYRRWVEKNELTPYLLEKMRQEAGRLAGTGPHISILVPTFNTPAAYLNELIASVTDQIYPNWQLCLADDASSEPHVRSILQRAAAADPRIEVIFRPVNGHIVQASNSALSLAKGEYVGLLDHDDLLSPDALLHVAEAILAEPETDFLYTDEDKLSPGAERYDPIFKGSFSPEMSLTHNYIQHFTVIRKRLVEEISGFREQFEGAQDLDLYLRVLEKLDPARVRHVPFVCYHWRSHPESTASSGAQKGYVFESARASIEENLERRKIRATPFLPDWAEKSNCCLYQLKWSPDFLKENPVTIVIPIKDRVDLLRKCLSTVERTIDVTSAKVVVVDDFSTDESTRTFLDRIPSETTLNCRVIQPRSQSPQFNFSQLINEGVAAADTPLVLLLNNDVEAMAPGWLEEMAGWMSLDGVGAVGAKLLYADNTIQHAGVVVGARGGLAAHIFHRLPGSVIGFNFLTHAARNVSAVTAACLLTSKQLFDEVGGFDQNELAMEYNDVDFCLRLARSNKRIVFTPQAVLLHHCGVSRGVGWRPVEHLNYLRRYGGVHDPFYNENLQLDGPDVDVDPNHFVHADRVGKLKVLMVSHNLNLEGAPRVLFDHAAFFSREAGYDVTIVSRQDGPLRRKVEEAGMQLRIFEDVMPRAREGTSDYVARLREIGRQLDIESCDLVVCNTLTSFWGVALAESFDLPVIWHIHESATLDQFFYSEPRPAGLVERCLKAADRVVFEASATRQVHSLYQKRDNFITIPGSIDVAAIDRFREKHTPRSLKIKYGIDPNKLVVCLIGTTCPRKGQHVFIQAIETMKEKWPDDIENTSFVMLGARESPYLDLLRSQLETLDGTDILLIEESHEVFDFYRLTDIFVCASFEESFPRVILEAMAFQLPIIATDVFGIPEIVTDLGEALLVPAGQSLALAKAIRTLLNNETAREELGARAYAKVTRVFNSPIQLKHHLNLTKEVVATHI
jgi:glycosyltransferase involved in cell wall biosynthesis/GT2 family glycosyltransferase